MTYDYVIVGGGIVGLATGMALVQKYPGCRLLVVDKEDRWGAHQTGNNSGVIHSGIYYKPGSYKAKFGIEGARLVPEFCREFGITHDVCGKVIVATEEWELPLLENLYQRGLQHGLAVTKIGPEQLKEIEPHCVGRAAIRVPTTGIADYKAMARQYAKLIEEQGGELRLGCEVLRVARESGEIILVTSTGDIHGKFLINCGGLQCDRIARRDGVDPQAKIVPFRGEYYELRPEKRYLCKHLIYPVPNPAFPFLGVHFTRMVDGNIHCGPNAVLALKREGYTWGDISLKDTFESLTYKGFWKLASRHMGDGLKEIYRSLNKAAFTRTLQRLIPEVQKDDLVPSHAGVRAQALMADGKMVDDFLIVRGDNSVHVCNAPSPAATASIPIGREIANMIPQVKPTRVMMPSAA